MDNAVLQQIAKEQAQISQTLAQFQLDFDKEIFRFETILSGMAYNEKGDLEQKHAPVMNEKGRNHIMKKVRSWMSKIIAQSNYNDKEIYTWCRVYWRELVLDATSYGEEWAMNYDEYASFVHDCVFTLHGMMNAAKNGGLRDIIGKISRVVESTVVNNPETKTAKL